MTTETRTPRDRTETPETVTDRIMAPPNDITDADIERRFTYHRPEGQKISDHDDVRARFKDWARELNRLLPAGREKSLAFTKLEEAANWAHAAIARDGK